MKKSTQKSTAIEYITLKEWFEMEKKCNEIWHTKAVSIDERERMEHKLQEAYKRMVPEVGDMGTEVLWSDRYAFEVVKIYTPNRVGIRRRNYIVRDWQNGDGEILEGFHSGEEIITRRKNGGWYRMGDKVTSGSVIFTFKYASTYLDPSF